MRIKSVVFLLTVVTSCSGDYQELKLLNYSDKNENVKIEVTETEYDEKDSLISEKKYLKVFDSKNRLINKNNSVFYFYNDNNKIDETKFIYRRGIVTKIIVDKYIYDKNGNLNLITTNFNTIDTIQTFKYNANNNLIEKSGKNIKHFYEYSREKIIEEKETQNNEVSKISHFVYDKNGNKIENNWVFGNQKMKTYYIYNSKNLIISERDSCITVFGNPNEFVEFLTEFIYNQKDSIIEKRDLGRILSENDFKLRGKTKYYYNTIR